MSGARSCSDYTSSEPHLAQGPKQEHTWPSFEAHFKQLWLETKVGLCLEQGYGAWARDWPNRPGFPFVSRRGRGSGGAALRRQRERSPAARRRKNWRVSSREHRCSPGFFPVVLFVCYHHILGNFLGNYLDSVNPLRPSILIAGEPSPETFVSPSSSLLHIQDELVENGV